MKSSVVIAARLQVHSSAMAAGENSRLYRFGPFEADEATVTLRRQGIRININAQAFRILLMLLEKPGEAVSREAIRQRLWPDGIHVDFDHGLNSAVSRIRGALCDSASTPRYIETLSRRGYRFIPEVECVLREKPAPQPSEKQEPAAQSSLPNEPAPAEPTAARTTPSDSALSLPVPEEPASAILASPEDLPQASHVLVSTLFVLLQAMYLAFYAGALANIEEVRDLFAELSLHPRPLTMLLVLSAAILIPVRLFLISACLFRPPRKKTKFLRLFPALLAGDILWALSPFLLLHHINFGLALALVAALVYAPFAQRSLMLMDRER